MTPDYVDVILKVAARDPSIARVLREICALDGPVRITALDLVTSHLADHALARELRECVAALRRDDVARQIAKALTAE